MDDGGLEQSDRKGTIAKLTIQHRNVLYAFIFSCVRNHHDAEELLQEVTVTVVSSFEKLRNESEFLPWAREIARRHVLSFIRKSSRPMHYNTELVDALAKSADENASSTGADERRDALRECLGKLSQSSRELLRMRYDGSVSGVDEIAQSIGRSMAATYGLLKRIRISLRTCVERKLGSGQ